MQQKVWAAGLLVAGLLGAGGGVQAQTIPAEVVFTGGTVITMDAGGSTAGAVAVRDGRIIAIGSEETLAPLITSETRVVDLAGRTLAPGFFAPHDHFPGSGTVAVHYVDANSPPIGEIETIDQLVEALAERAAAVPAGSWIVARGYDDTLLEEHRHPTRYDLDRASTEHPIWVRHISGHLGVGNSLALEIAEVTRDTPQPNGGVIQMDPETGEPNGVFEESGSLVSRHIPGFTRDERLAAMEWAAEEYLSHGVTTTVIAGNSGRRKIQDLIDAQQSGLMRDLRVITMATWATRRSEATQEILAPIDPTRLRIGAIKIIQDGSIQGFTGNLTEPYHTPYHGDPHYSGYPRRDQEGLDFYVVRAHCEGYQVAVHANGDAAIDETLEAYATAQAQCPRADARHRIEHAQMARPDQIERMKALGLSPSYFVGHVFYWGDRHRDIFMGPERAARISPLRTTTDHGIRWTIHQDTPVTPIDPLHSVWVAVNRVTTGGEVLGPEERVTALEGMRAITSWAAWQNHVEDERGSIEAGKLADFVVLSENPLTVPPMEISDIEVLATFIGGEEVYRAAR